MYRPEPSVTIDAGRIAAPVIVTVAPGSAPPETSVTMPMRRERSACADTDACRNQEPRKEDRQSNSEHKQPLDEVLYVSAWPAGF
jgi:hypothetical protein